MALPNPHPTLREQTVSCYSPSVGGSPTVGYARAPFRGQIVKWGMTLYGTLTGDATVTLAVAGTNSTGTMTATASGSVGGTVYTKVPGANTFCNEDDNISFTSASGTGSSIAATYFVVIQTA